MKKLPLIFIVEDNHFYAKLLKEELFDENSNRIEVFYSGETCLNNLNQKPDVVILDHDLGATTGIEVLKKIKGFNPNIQVVFMSAQEKIHVAVAALKHGVYDYVEKNKSTIRRLKPIIKRIIRYNKKRKEIRQYRHFKIAILFVMVLVSAIILNHFV